MCEALTYLNVDYQAESPGAVITRDVEGGVQLNTRWNGFAQFRYLNNPTRAANLVIHRQ